MKRKLLLLVLLFATPLWAHQPKVLTEEMSIDHPGMSDARYGAF